MIKGFGILSCLAFLILCTQIGGFSPGFHLWFLSVLLVVCGILAYSLLQFPAELENGSLQRLMQFGKKDLPALISVFEELSTAIRKDGLLAIEANRKDLKDPFLQYLLKKVISGFSPAQINGVLRNQFLRSQELFALAQSFIDRVLSGIPLVGLIGSLFQVMDILNRGASVVGFVFIPFILSLLFQLAVQASFLELFFRSFDGSRLYFILLEEGIHGIQEGISPELLRDKMQARISDTFKGRDS